MESSAVVTSCRRDVYLFTDSNMQYKQTCRINALINALTRD